MMTDLEPWYEKPCPHVVPSVSNKLRKSGDCKLCNQYKLEDWMTACTNEPISKAECSRVS